jgi:hypothetical protein
MNTTSTTTSTPDQTTNTTIVVPIQQVQQQEKQLAQVNMLGYKVPSSCVLLVVILILAIIALVFFGMRGTFNSRIKGCEDTVTSVVQNPLAGGFKQLGGNKLGTFSVTSPADMNLKRYLKAFD